MSSGAAAAALIIFGGGWGAEGTQASIEAHVFSLREVLRDRSPQVLFASGDPKVRDVQIALDEVDETSLLLGVVFDHLEHLDVSYRPSTVPRAGGASRKALLAAIDSTAGAPGGTIIFGVGHGSPSSSESDAALSLFGPDDDLTVARLAGSLDAKVRKAPIAFVLGHCHSGAFTDIAWTDANPKNRLAEPARCVFAAVPPERQASGCSPDAGDPEARAYMAVIAEALSDVKNADLDHNGRVSLAEAHTHARVFDRTIDVPVSTSEVWLRRFRGVRAARPQSVALERLLPRARPTERRVIFELRPPGLETTPKSAAEEVEKKTRAMEELDKELDVLQREYDQLRRLLVDQVLLVYPELANVYHAESRRLIAGEARELVELIKKLPQLGALDEKKQQLVNKESERFELEKRVARIERWLAAVSVIANEDAVRRSGNKQAVAALDRLLSCEAMEP